SKCWITSNLGADHQATFRSDATEASAGWYWQFNRKQGYKVTDDGNRTPNSTWITNINENSDWIAVNDPCSLELGNGWRIPVFSELNNIKTIGNWTNWDGPWTSGLKMHGAGYLDFSSGALTSRGSNGSYWSSSQGNDPNGGNMNFTSGYINVSGINNKAYGISLRCIRDAGSSTTTPTVTTTPVSNITQTTATSGGNIPSDGGAPVTSRGVCWSTSQNPTIADNFTSDGPGSGAFTSSITGLTTNTLYYYRAYATNSAGTGYGNEGSFTTIGESPCQGTPTITDIRDGKTYNTVQIGAQCWMRENLNIGTMIPGSSEQTNQSAIEKYCYNDDEANCIVYGGLYQWNNMMQWSTIERTQGICPTGWHLPTDGEWTTLTDFLGGVSVAGGSMKEEGTAHWTAPNTGATNGSNFTALPGGQRNFDGYFSEISNNAFFWSSSQIDVGIEWPRILTYNHPGVYRNSFLQSFGFSVRCLKGEGAPGDPATVTTDEAMDITPTSALSGGNVTNNGGSPVTARGVCWSTSQNPTIADNFTSDGTGTGVFTSSVTGLAPNTMYYMRAYATNSVATGYGNEVSFTTASSSACGQQITDIRDGKTYNTVQIGTQCWMAQNLNIGAMISGSLNQTNHNAIEKYCYSNDEANCTVYGGLYQWNNMMQWSITEGIEGICPAGWHIPTDGEWTALTDFLGGVSVAGGKMKEAGTAHWLSPNTGATNECGFTALPGGGRTIDPYFLDLTHLAYFWSSSQSGGSNSWFRYLNNDNEVMGRIGLSKNNGFSVRCIRDQGAMY
ncbi:MAG: FISUMP domain-containing protein, partial [Bacteroidota bacterium]